jgi:putative hydrolase of the HAD superfamily
MLEAVIFDWGGTLSVWADIDLEDMWRLAARHISKDHERELVHKLIEVERTYWTEVESTQTSRRLADLFVSATAAVGVDVAEIVVEEASRHHLDAWTPHVRHDPDAPHVLAELRARGLSIGLLSNTFWPGEWHEHFLERDGLIDLIDKRVYTSDLPYTKPHGAAFRAALDAVGVADPAAAMFVGDRQFDDILGANRAGLVSVWKTNSNSPPHPDAEPDHVIEELPELIPIADRLLTNRE